MNTSTYLSLLSPECCLLAGACLVWLVGVSRSAGIRASMAGLTLAVVAVAMFLAWRCPSPEAAAVMPGIRMTSLSEFVRWATLIVGALLLLANWRVPADREQGEYFGMMLCSMAGVSLTACSNDLIVLFFALELVSVPTYVMVALSRTHVRASESAVKYFFLGALAAAIMAYGFSFLYGVSGSTVLEGGAGQSLAKYFAGDASWGPFALIGLVLAFSGLAFKVAAAPFHAYAADVYEGAASPLTAFLGFIPKLAGFTALIKLMAVCGWPAADGVSAPLMWMLWVVAALTMTVGNVLALLQHNVKRMLAYSSIAHSGYMLVGILVGPMWGTGPMRDGVAAVLFYIVVYGVMNLGAFAVLSNLSIKGEPAETLDDLAGLSRRAPLSAFAMAVCAFSLMGFPPTAGFIGKVYLFSGAFAAGETSLIVLAVIGVLNSAIGAAYYLKIASACYVREPVAEQSRTGGLTQSFVLAVCSLAMFCLFLRPNDLVRQARSATESVRTAGQASIARVDRGAVGIQPIAPSDDQEHAG